MKIRSTEHALEWLTKTDNSLIEHVKRGYLVDESRSTDLINRFNILKGYIRHYNKRSWNKWCRIRDYDYDTDGYDYFEFQVQ